MHGGAWSRPAAAGVGSSTLAAAGELRDFLILASVGAGVGGSSAPGSRRWCGRVRMRVRERAREDRDERSILDLLTTHLSGLQTAKNGRSADEMARRVKKLSPILS